MNLSLHYLEVNQGISNKVINHDVESSQQQKYKRDQKDHFNVGDVEKITCFKNVHIEERTLEDCISYKKQP